MNEIKSLPIQSLVFGDLFMFGSDTPYVCVATRTEGNMTTVEYRLWYDGQGQGQRSAFTRVNLATALVFGREYDLEAVIRKSPK